MYKLLFIVFVMPEACLPIGRSVIGHSDEMNILDSGLRNAGMTNKETDIIKQTLIKDRKWIYDNYPWLWMAEMGRPLIDRYCQ